MSAYAYYIKTAQTYIEKTQETLKIPVATGIVNVAYSVAISENIKHAEHQIDLIKRRIFEKEKIPHKDKIFSIFETHTEWINKGKAGVPVELGLRVYIVEHPSGYILHHMVMENKTDSEIVIEIIKQTQKLYPEFKACSFEKGSILQAIKLNYKNYWMMSYYLKKADVINKKLNTKAVKILKQQKENIQRLNLELTH